MDIATLSDSELHSQMDSDCADEILRLRRELTAEKERADYAWRNANTIEKARQEEMAKRDVLQQELTAARNALLCEGMQRDKLQARYNWLASLFERKWNGVVGISCQYAYNLVGNWRHFIQSLSGRTLDAAIDAAIAKTQDGSTNG